MSSSNQHTLKQLHTLAYTVLLEGSLGLEFVSLAFLWPIRNGIGIIILVENMKYIWTHTELSDRGSLLESQGGHESIGRGPCPVTPVE